MIATTKIELGNVVKVRADDVPYSSGYVIEISKDMTRQHYRIYLFKEKKCLWFFPDEIELAGE